MLSYPSRTLMEELRQQRSQAGGELKGLSDRIGQLEGWLREQDARLVETTAQLEASAQEIGSRDVRILDLEQALETTLLSKAKEISNLNALLGGRDEQISSLVEELSMKEAAIHSREEQIQNLYNSTSWRMTAPGRWISDQVKRCLNHNRYLSRGRCFFTETFGKGSSTQIGKNTEEQLPKNVLERKLEQPEEGLLVEPSRDPRLAGQVFEYGAFKIPLDLVHSTGGGPETFEHIAEEHTTLLKREIGVSADSQIVEIGCGIGRDAIPLTEILDARGSYLGIDVIERSIQWSNQNITVSYPNFRFLYLDIQEQWYNPNGKLQMKDVAIPVPDGATDIILLHSVFTHMLEKDIVHYLKEFRRILKPSGSVLATFFVVDEEIRKSAQENNYLSFNHKISEDCYIEDPQHPTRAVGYPINTIHAMAKSAGLVFKKPVLYGFWSGHHPGPHHGGQDAIIFKSVPV